MTTTPIFPVKNLLSTNIERKWPSEGISRAPYWVYTDSDIYLQEQARIFRGNAWHYLGLDAEVPNSGDYKTTYIGDTSVLMVRNEDGNVNGLVNRCAHRGNMVCRDAFGSAQSLYCVYHAWSYDLKGNLKNAAFSRGIRGEGGLPKDFEKSNHGLIRITYRKYLWSCFCYL
jgi:phenylpropionate dioxygenase-like ring-hydroxylating dioxygenase large terminal subunit